MTKDEKRICKIKNELTDNIIDQLIGHAGLCYNGLLVKELRNKKFKEKIQEIVDFHLHRFVGVK